jgi:predicted dehydrogenase
VLDLADGRRLADLADDQGVVPAVNQNGRWAPHFAWMREAVRARLVGDLHSVHASVHWDHGWIRGTPFEDIPDLVFIDFGMHWFDFLASLIGDREAEVTATFGRAGGQEAKPPLLAQALVAFDGGQAALLFDAATRWGPLDRTVVTGSKGTLLSQGPDLGTQTVTLTTAEGRATPKLEGQWFNDGFRGAMAELLVAAEARRQPLHGARGNLASLALAFAAIASARRGQPVRAGSVGSLAEARASP